jgi:hypothetical protein
MEGDGLLAWPLDVSKILDEVVGRGFFPQPTAVPLAEVRPHACLRGGAGRDSNLLDHGLRTGSRVSLFRI